MSSPSGPAGCEPAWGRAASPGLFQQVITPLAPRAGREDSIKLTPGALGLGRRLYGMPARQLPWGEAQRLALALGMPAVYLGLMQRLYPRASAVLFGLEPRARVDVHKVYLEFWDDVHRRLCHGAPRGPLLMNLGVKWPTDRPQDAVLSRYRCLPLLSPADAMGRMVALLGRRPAGLAAACVGLVGQAARHASDRSFMYLEVAEGRSPRRSFDINLYPCGLRLDAALHWVVRLGQALGLDVPALQAAFESHAHRRLGHLSAGVGRDGLGFATVYFEISPMP